MKFMQYLNQISAVVLSPSVDQYLVGITSNVKVRRKSYESNGFPVFLILEVELEKDRAITVERELFNSLVSDKSSIMYEKYHHKKRDGKYHASTGGKHGNCYAVYIAAFGS